MSRSTLEYCVCGHWLHDVMGKCWYLSCDCREYRLETIWNLLGN